MSVFLKSFLTKIGCARNQCITSTLRILRRPSHYAPLGAGTIASMSDLQVACGGIFVFGGTMKKIDLNIGILFSTSGSYRAVGDSMRAGAKLAISEINDDPRSLAKLVPVLIDPGGDTASYVTAAKKMLCEQKITHVFGCYTSSSRKEVLPFFEKHDGLLWYPSHYEGFETSENVIYTGAAPNQHILPLSNHLLEHHGNRGWFVGSNYVWAWENNRILRERLMEVGGAVVGERYFPVGETDMGSLARQIVSDRPDFVFTTLIGKSGYAFFQALREAAGSAGLDQPKDMPVASCSLSEAELPDIGSAAAGHLSSSVYFSTIVSPENERFVSEWNRNFADLGQACADAEATYNAVHLLSQAVTRAGSGSFAAVREAVKSAVFNAPQGMVTVNPDNLHCAMRPRIGRSRSDGTFEILHSEKEQVQPDPYLVWSNQANQSAKLCRNHLRVVQ